MLVNKLDEPDTFLAQNEIRTFFPTRCLALADSMSCLKRIRRVIGRPPYLPV